MKRTRQRPTVTQHISSRNALLFGLALEVGSFAILWSAANLLAAMTTDAAAERQIYNVAVGGRMSLNELYAILRELTSARHPQLRIAPPAYEDFRAGDVRHSQADIGKAKRLLGYAPTYDVRSGLAESLGWYDARFAAPSAAARNEVGVHGAE